MSVHHLVKDAELMEACPYCNKGLPEAAWKSHWLSWKHYKTATCGCGKDIWLRVWFDGSGHDSWNTVKSKRFKGEPHTLEQKIGPKVSIAPKQF